MQAIEYTTEVSALGQFTVPPELLKSIDLKRHQKIRVVLLFEDPKKTHGLSHFCGQWQDERETDEIVKEIYNERNRNYRSETVVL